MHALAQVAKVEIMAVVALLYWAIAYGLLTGRINTGGLLERKRGSGLDPGRLQALIVTLFLAGSLLTNLGEMQGPHLVSLPSNWLLAALGGSHGLYLHRKYSQRNRSSNGRIR